MHRYQTQKVVERLAVVGEEPVGGDVAVKAVPLEAPRQPTDAISRLEQRDFIAPFPQQRGTAESRCTGTQDCNSLHSPIGPFDAGKYMAWHGSLEHRGDPRRERLEP